MSRVHKGLVKVVLLLFVLSTFFSVGVRATSVQNRAAAPSINRLGGATRISTSTIISQSAYKDGADTVILIGSLGEIDAVGGTLLASKLDAPILMTNKDRLSTSTKAEIERLQAKKIIILGGDTVVSEKVVQELSGYHVERISGRNREDTAIKVAQRAMGDEIEEIFVGLGYDIFADVLAVGPATAKLSKPVLLARKTGLSERTKDAIKAFGVKKVTIVGGVAAIPLHVEETLRDMGITVDRISGRTREETAISLAKAYFEEPSEVVLANGYVFADSVVGGYYAYKKNAPIILTRANSLASSTSAYLAEMKKDVTILGLASAVNEIVEFEVGTIIKETIPTDPSGQVNVGIYELYGDFNPLYSSSVNGMDVIDLVFDRLVTTNFLGDAFELRMAKDWEIKNEGKTITFYLKEDILFSDGTPMTAHDVVFTYKVLADPSYTGRYGSSVRGLVGYEQYNSGATESFPGVVAEDDYTVTFNFYQGARSNVQNTMIPILPASHYGKDYRYGDTSTVEAITLKALGSGPYIIEQYKKNESITLKRRANYHGEGYLIEELKLHVVNQRKELDSLLSGEIDLLHGVIEAQIINSAQEKGFEVQEYPRSGYGYINFNTEAGPTAETKVRQALTYAFDTERFVNAYYRDWETQMVLASTQNHPFSQVSWVIDEQLLQSLTDYSYDIIKAKSLLDEAGWVVNGKYREKGGQVLELNIAAMPEDNTLSTVIPMWQESWGDELNIKLNIKYYELSTILDYVMYESDENIDKWNLFFLATSISTADPDFMYSAFHSSNVGSGENNTARYRNAQVDRLFDEARAILDPKEAKPLYAEIVQILNDEMPRVVIYANNYYDLYHAKLKNFNTSALYRWTAALKDAYIRD